MSTPKYIEGPNTVQTSLYGYDRNKKVQLNNLRGRPIVVLRSDSSENERNCGNTANHSNTRPPKKWIDRSNQLPASNSNKSMYPSYAHFHHQYSCPKGNTNGSPIPPFSNGQPVAFTNTAHDRSSPRSGKITPPASPKLSPEEEIAAKRVFDKLHVPTPSPTVSPCSNISTDITILELTPKMTAKVFSTSSIVCDDSENETTTSSVSPPETTFMVDTPRSLSDSRRTSTSSESSEDVPTDISEVSAINEKVSGEKKPRIHICQDEMQCLRFRDGVCASDEMERKMMLEWYDDLIQWRHDIVTKTRFGPPRCHPPPLTITIIGASRAQRANPFHRVGEVHPFAMEAMDYARRKMDARRTHRLVPVDLPLPPPHEFMANAKCMEPHLFIEYCYQLTAAAYVDTGLNPPNRRPPIPPRIEPIPDQTWCRESLCSSASEISSDGEYSDDSDDTKQERLRLKMERHSKRERRLQQLFRRRHLDEIDEEDDD